MWSGSVLVFCAGSVVENDRFEEANDRLRKAAESENGSDMADLDWRPAIVMTTARGWLVYERETSGGRQGTAEKNLGSPPW